MLWRCLRIPASCRSARERRSRSDAGSLARPKRVICRACSKPWSLLAALDCTILSAARGRRAPCSISLSANHALFLSKLPSLRRRGWGRSTSRYMSHRLSHTLRVALAQMNLTVGDIDGNTEKIIANIAHARERGRGSGRLPRAGGHRLSAGGPAAQAELRRGQPRRPRPHRRARPRASRRSSGSWTSTQDIYNAAAIIHDGEIAGVQHKFFLPNYGVFDEDRYFQAGTSTQVYTLGRCHVRRRGLRGRLVCRRPAHAAGADGRRAHRSSTSTPRRSTRASGSFARGCSAPARATTPARSST